MDQPVVQPQKDARNNNSLSADYTTSRTGFESSRQAEARQTEARQNEATRETTESRQAEARQTEATREATPNEATRPQEAARETTNIERTAESNNITESSPVVVGETAGTNTTIPETSISLVDPGTDADLASINEALNLSLGDDDAGASDDILIGADSGFGAD